MTDNEEDGVEHAGVEAEDALPSVEPNVEAVSSLHLLVSNQVC